jgi:hypothetical protein
VRVTAPVLADTWYHAAGIVHYNESDPANSSIELFLAAGAPINLGTDSQGTAAIDLSSASVLVGWAAELDVVNGPDAIPGDPDNDPSDNKNRYFIGCGSNNAINGDDYRGLLGEIDAVAVTAQDTEIYLPDAPPAPAVLGTAAWGSYR